MGEKEQNALLTCPLFRGCEPNRVTELLKKARTTRQKFSSGEAIPFRGGGQSRIGILISGGARVYAKDEKRTPLNRLTPGCVFGIASLYSPYDSETVVVAKNADTSVLFLEEEHLATLLEDRIICGNLIAFLTGRIRFLTGKIASFTAPSAEKKLARFLSARADENGIVTSFSSYADLARSLNLGRASLYRALEALGKEGAIQKDGKCIHIISRSKLNLFL